MERRGKTRCGLAGWALAATVVLVGPGGCGDVPDDPAARETVARPLVGCRRGDPAFIRVGPFDDHSADLVSPQGGQIHRYGAHGAEPFMTVSEPVTDHWGPAVFTWTAPFLGGRKVQLGTAAGGAVFIHSLNTVRRPPVWTTQTRLVPDVWGASGYTFAANFAGDERADIVTARGNDIHLHRSSGDSFVTVTSHIDHNTWGPESRTFAGDFDGDGWADIASAGDIAVFMKLSSESGRFTAPTWRVTSGWGRQTFAGKFDGDAFMDLISIDGPRILRKMSSGAGFVSFTDWVTDSWGSATWIGDFNGDGRVDLASNGGDRMFMKLADSGGWGFRSETWAVTNQWGGDGFNQVGDFNGDRKTDILSLIDCTVILRTSTGVGFETRVF